MPLPRRSPDNQRLCEIEHVRRLAFMRHARELGFSQAAIRELLVLTDAPNQPCEAVTMIAARHLEHVKERIERLSALKVELERMIATCKGSKISDCRILATLANQSHGHCVTPPH